MCQIFKNQKFYSLRLVFVVVGEKLTAASPN